MRIRGFPSVVRWVASSPLQHEVHPVARQRERVLRWIDGRRRLGMTRDEACRIAGISPRTYTRWAAAFRRRGLTGLVPGTSRPRSPRDPWKRREVREDVERLRKARKVGKEKLAILLAENGIQVSASTVGRVLRELFARGVIAPIGYERARSANRRRAAQRTHARRKNPHDRATRPGELVQIDTLHEASQDRPRTHFTAIDPVQRFVHAKLAPSAGSRNAQAFLHDVLACWPHPISSIQVDNGSEFMGAFEATCHELGIDLITIPPRTPKANAHVERMQRTFRDEHYAYEAPTLTLEEAQAELDRYLHFYNHHRPHHALGLKPPMTYTHPENPQTSQTT